jgi:hypothetical protein
MLAAMDEKRSTNLLRVETPDTFVSSLLDSRKSAPIIPDALVLDVVPFAAAQRLECSRRHDSHQQSKRH